MLMGANQSHNLKALQNPLMERDGRQVAKAAVTACLLRWLIRRQQAVPKCAH